MTEHKDVIIAMLGSSSGFAGLVLVFLGFVLTTYQGFGAATPKRVLNKYRLMAGLVLGAFCVCIATVVLAAWWLLLVHPGNWLYVTTAVAFFAQLVSLSFTAGLNPDGVSGDSVL